MVLRSEAFSVSRPMRADLGPSLPAARGAFGGPLHDSSTLLFGGSVFSSRYTY